jgi:hypothetical protein
MVLFLKKAVFLFCLIVFARENVFFSKHIKISENTQCLPNHDCRDDKSVRTNCRFQLLSTAADMGPM